MRIEHTIKVDFQRPGVRPVIRVAEGDASTRFIVANLYNGGEPFSVGSGVTGVVKYTKTDGHSGVYDTLDKDKASERDAVVFHDNSRQAVVELAPNICMGYGLVALIVQFVDSSGTNILSTFPVDVIVERDPTNGTEAEEYFSYKALDELYAAIDEANAYATAALTASMKDISAEYADARVSRPSLTPAAYMMEQADGLYRINTDGGDDVFVGRVVTINGDAYLELSEFFAGSEYLRTVYIDGIAKTTIHIDVRDDATSIEPRALVERVSVAVAESSAAVRANGRQDRQISNIAAAIGGIIENVSETITSRAAILRGGILPYGSVDRISETYVSAITVGKNIIDSTAMNRYGAYIHESSRLWVVHGDSTSVKVPITVGRRYRVSIIDQAGAIFRSAFTDAESPTFGGERVYDMIVGTGDHDHAAATKNNLIVQVSTSSADHDLPNICVVDLDTEERIDIPILIKNNQAYIAGTAVVDFDAKTMTAGGSTIDISSVVDEDGFWIPNLSDNAVVRFEPANGAITSVDISYQNRIGG